MPMSQARIQNIKRTLLHAVVTAAPFAALGLAIPRPAAAFFSFLLGPAAATLIISTLLYLAQSIATLLFSFAGYMAAFMLELNYRIFDNALALSGWQVTRDIANLGFVLFLVIIGIATIVRYREYAAKALLPKLIAAALIVNFSFAIAQIFISFSNSLTTTFFNAISPAANGTTALITSLQGAFEPQKLLTPPTDPQPIDPVELEDVGSWLSGLATGAVLNVASQAFTLLFTLIATFVMFVFGFLLLIRYLHLVLLIILAPLAWLFFVFPNLSGLYSKWWGAFIKWNFFAPATAFFFYLAVYGVKGLGLGANSSSAVAVDGFFSATGGLGNIVQQGTQMFLLCGLLIGGLLVAQTMSIKAASSAISLGSKYSKAAGNWASGKARSAGTNLGRRALTAGTDQEGKTALQRLGSVKVAGRELRGIPVVGRAFTGASGASTKAQANMAKDAEAWAKKYDGGTKEDLVAMAKESNNRLATPAEKAGLLIAAAKAGGLEDLMKDPATKQSMLKAARMTGMGEKLLAYDPSLAPEFAERKSIKYTDVRSRKEMERPETDEEMRTRVAGERDKLVGAAVRNNVKDASELTETALNDPAVLRALSPKHISQLSEIEIEDKVHIKENIEKSIVGASGMFTGQQLMPVVEKLRKDISDLTKQIDDAKDDKNAPEEKRLRALKRDVERRLSNATDSLSPQGKESLRVRDTMADNAAWGDAFPYGSGKKK
jgi:hypothetical protein